jgi:hypothetical protein
MHPGQKVSKARLITLLNSLEVNIEADTKRTGCSPKLLCRFASDPLFLSVADLEITLDKALDGCQSIHDIPNLIGKDGFVDVDSFPERATVPGQQLAPEMVRNTIAEAVGGWREDDAKTSFDSLRQLVWYIGSRFEEGKESIYLMDTEGVSAICIRVSDYRQLSLIFHLLIL